MPVSTTTNNDPLELAQPSGEHPLFEREGFDEPQLRREFATVTSLNIDDEIVERDEKEFVDPATLDLPVGPLGREGARGGTGIDTVRMDGEEWPTYLFGSGFTLRENIDLEQKLPEQREAAMEMLQFFGDVAFLHGLDRASFSTDADLNESVFDWMRSNVPSARTFDLESYDGDSGDNDDLNGVEHELFTYEALSAIGSPKVLDVDSGWDLVVGAPDAINRITGKVADYKGGEGRASYWDRLQDVEPAPSSVMRLPYNLSPATLPEDLDEGFESPPEIPLVDQSTAVDPSGAPLGYDEVFVIPNMDIFAEEYVWNGEMGGPQVDVTDMERLKRRFDYMWRYGQKWDPLGEHPNVTDALHLTNVSALFD